MPSLEKTLTLNEIECDKCCGTGRVYGNEIHFLIKRWRLSLEIPAKNLALIAKIPYTSYCKFENGRIVFGEARLRKLIEILSDWGSAICR